MPKKLTVVISQSQGRNPAKRNLEEDIAATLMLEGEVDVSLVPHLVDLHADHTGLLFLKSVPGDLIVASWLFPRAARWILDRQGVKGHEGQTLLKSESDEDEDDEEEGNGEEKNPDAMGAWNVPNRKVYCIDLRAYPDSKTYLDEIRRIAREKSVQTFDLMSFIQGQPKAEQLERYLNPTKRVNGHDSVPDGKPSPNGNGSALPVMDEDEPTRRRWYPVIDYSRCTNCMECIDFCLFGVYGVDGQERILVEQQDNCKKGCPACSRVCPANAIIFPEHKTPAIAGAETGTAAGLKVDLSKLFGAPSAIELAALERDDELVKDGREAVGLTVGIPKRQSDKPQAHDALDDLMDGLDQMDL
ncbi:MAG: ferredoxin family protein [Planctomycetales bacterium]|nr:ferredoxin family protein [Planctomycetales bacterium]